MTAPTHEQVHRAGPVIDLHLDSLLWTRLVGYDLSRRHRNIFPRSPYGFHSDLPRMLAGGVTGAYFGLHSWPFTGERAFREIVRQVEAFHGIVARDRRLRFGDSPEAFLAAHADGVVAGTMGLEGAHGINGRLERVEYLYEAGVRYMTLAHFHRNRAATPALGWRANEEDGLSAYGRELVHEMNRVGMIVDCAHLNETCRLEVAQRTTRPILVTHTGVKAVVDHPRNISDASIRAVAKTGGVIGIMFAPIFISGRLLGTIGDVVAHVRHVHDLVGIEHVAIGTDFDGFIPTVPKEVQDIAALPTFTAALLHDGFEPAQISAVLGGNVIAFLQRHAALTTLSEDRARSGNIEGSKTVS